MSEIYIKANSPSRCHRSHLHPCPQSRPLDVIQLHDVSQN